MKINEDTKLIARFYNVPNGRGLNIYNPYLDATGVNAVYLLFHNPDPKPLFNAMRELGIVGAIPAAFEKDPKMTNLVDKLEGIGADIKRVSFVKNTGTELVGYYAAGRGLMDAILEQDKISGKNVVIMGAGTVVRGLLAEWRRKKIKPNSIFVYTRDKTRLDLLKKEYSEISVGGDLVEMESSKGEIFINATPVGSPWNKGDDYIWKDKWLQGFGLIVDVTFVPLAPPLISSAQRLGIKYAPGWKMFLYQGKYALETILDIKVDSAKLAEFLVDDFAKNWS
jgi:shikimate 5-dehydrogenase